MTPLPLCAEDVAGLCSVEAGSAGNAARRRPPRGRRPAPGHRRAAADEAWPRALEQVVLTGAGLDARMAALQR